MPLGSTYEVGALSAYGYAEVAGASWDCSRGSTLRKRPVLVRIVGRGG
jgi:hypothetical protein